MTETTFGALGVPAPLVAALDRAGITSPFPIQEDTLPDTLRGRDVLGRGKTGSGKTLAFSIPMVARLSDGNRPQSGRPRGLILAPTRELATQITAALSPLAAAYGMSVTTIFGGISQQRQVAALKAGVDIVVACPGRLEDLMQQKHVTLDAIEITVLDEADHMADLGFLPVVTRILNKTPDGGQRMLFSATLDNGVDKIVNRYLHNEIMHSVDEATSHVEAMTHHVFEVDGVDTKRELVQALASGMGRRILFMRTKHHAKKLARQLTEAGIPSVDLHGNLSQPQRDRNLATFSSGEARVLVATDVAARGIDIGDVELVVHVDPPAEHKAYLHRSGRTARAGSSGDVVTVMLPAQKSDVTALLRKAAIAVTPERVTVNSPAVAALIGDVAAYVKPTPRAAAPVRGQSQGGRSQGANAQRKQARRGGHVVAAHAAGGQNERRDRSGRPAASGAPQGARAGQARSGQVRSGQPASAKAGQARSARGAGGSSSRGFTSYSTSSPAPSGGERRSGRRAQG
jgi:superfamily II DNA/RNA helicase